MTITKQQRAQTVASSRDKCNHLSLTALPSLSARTSGATTTASIPPMSSAWSFNSEYPVPPWDHVVVINQHGSPPPPPPPSTPPPAAGRLPPLSHAKLAAIFFLSTMIMLSAITFYSVRYYATHRPDQPAPPPRPKPLAFLPEHARVFSKCKN